MGLFLSGESRTEVSGFQVSSHFKDRWWLTHLSDWFSDHHLSPDYLGETQRFIRKNIRSYFPKWEEMRASWHSCFIPHGDILSSFKLSQGSQRGSKKLLCRGGRTGLGKKESECWGRQGKMTWKAGEVSRGLIMKDLWNHVKGVARRPIGNVWIVSHKQIPTWIWSDWCLETVLWLRLESGLEGSNRKQAALGSCHNNPGERCGLNKVVAKQMNGSEKYFGTQKDRTLWLLVW